MKTTKKILFNTAISIAVALSAANAFAQRCYPNSQGIPDNVGVALSQVTWSFPNVSGDGVSGTGQVDVNVPELIAYTQQEGDQLLSGFLNVVTKDDEGNVQWVVENLYILPGYPYTDLSTMFYLNDGSPIEGEDINAAVCYSQYPFASAPSLSSLLPFKVGSKQFNAEGVGGQVAQVPPPPPINIAFPTPLGNLFSGNFQPNHPNVEAAVNQCTVASMANNFTWLKTTYGIGIPDPNNPGLRDNVSLAGKLDFTHWSDPRNADPFTPYCGNVVGRAAVSRIDGCAVYPQWWLPGYMTYLNGNNIALTLKHQGDDNAGFSGANNVTVGNLTSMGQGNIVQPSFINNEIANNSAVEYADAHPGGGGHAMDIIGSGTVLGAPFILYVSDHDQLNDNNGTQYVDFSFLCKPGFSGLKLCAQDPTQAPVAWLGDEDGSTVDTVFTQHP
jgi:hypothetical protein